MAEGGVLRGHQDVDGIQVAENAEDLQDELDIPDILCADHSRSRSYYVL